MIENISENMTSSSEQDWAIFPFDQTTDGKRWVKLIEEIDALTRVAEGKPIKSVEYSVDANALK